MVPPLVRVCVRARTCACCVFCVCIYKIIYIHIYILGQHLWCLIHSLRNLSYDRSTASSKSSSPQIAMWRFLFQFPVSYHFRKVIQYQLTSPSSSSCHFYLPFKNVFRKQFIYTVCRMFLSSLTLSNISSFFTRSVQFIFPILLQHHISKTYPDTYDLLSEVSLMLK
jgi:hypothetical protein